MAEAIGPLGAVLVTHERPDIALDYLDILGRQTCLPATVVVVDNSSHRDDSLAAAAEALARARSIEVRYTHSRVNLGPAGGFNAGVTLLPDSSATVVFMDDDDPPSSVDAIEVLHGEASRRMRQDVRLAAVGFRGATFNPRTARAHACAGTGAADHLHGGYLPLYRLDAFRAVGGFDPYLFWGFEELDLGRRLVRGGWNLVGLNDLTAAHTWSPKLRRRESPGTSWLDGRSGWSRYLTTRNLAWLTRRESAVSGPAVLMVRMTIRALATDLVRRDGSAMTRNTLRGLADGFELRSSMETSFERILHEAAG